MLVTNLTPELYCSDIKASLHFYIEILGFNIQYQRNEEGFAVLEREGSRIMLEEVDFHDIKNPERRWITGVLEKPFGRGINLQILTDQIDNLYDSVIKSQSHIFMPIENKWYHANEVELGQRQFIVMDPDGYLLRFYQDIGQR